MAYIDLHEKPFKDATIAKLELFEDYAQAWIPTFVMSGHRVICIFDFFAGTGYDKNGVAGSPIRILQKIQEQAITMLQKGCKVKVFFNEKETDKFKTLEESCRQFLVAHEDTRRITELSLYNQDFKDCFPLLESQIRQYPSLVYLDQNGIKFLADEYLLAFERMAQTDFLYFVSSSYFIRFGNLPEFKTHLSIDIEEARKQPYPLIHRHLLQQLRNKLPANTQLRLYPFSIKKGANIHGIIFGCSHPRAAEKFLTLSWTKNELNGEANFDLEDDHKKAQLDMFEGKRLTKVESFQRLFREQVLCGNIKNNLEAFNFVLDNGHIGNHAADELKKMKKEKLVDFEGTSPLINYDNVYKKRRMLDFKLLKK